jgi:hypothetical protein
LNGSDSKRSELQLQKGFRLRLRLRLRQVEQLTCHDIIIIIIIINVMSITVNHGQSGQRPKKERAYYDESGNHSLLALQRKLEKRFAG